MKKQGKIQIHPLSPLPRFLLFQGGEIWELPLFLLCAAVHEGGHLFAMAVTGVKCSSFSLSPLGAQIQTEDAFYSYKKELAIFLAGPLSNALCAAGALIFLRHRFTEPLLFFFCTSLFLSLFHLFPAFDSDGYKALSSFLCLFWDPWETEPLLLWVGKIGVFFLTAGGILLLWKTGNFTLLIFALTGWADFFKSSGKS